MDNEVIASQNDSDRNSTYLPVELLLYIMCYLPTRDKMKMRYVSKKFREISETPLLWKEFIWPDWEPRHVCSVNNVLQRCGEHVRQIFFPAHVPPTKILEMVRYCGKVTELSLPFGTQLYLIHLQEILHTMTHLQILDVFASGKHVKDLLEVTTCNVKELKLRISEYDGRQTLRSIEKWTNEGNTLPTVINILTRVTKYLVHQLFKFWEASNLKLSSCEISLYDSAKVPMDLYPSVPLIKMQFGSAVAVPFFLSKHGILGLDEEMLFVTGYDHYGKSRHSLAIVFVDSHFNLEKRYLKFSVTNLHSVTHVSFAYAKVFSGHLEQLALACPNLQRLNLMYVTDCLQSLQGLCAIIRTCNDLQGLNLVGISASSVESYQLLWELLSGVKRLTHLAIDLCMLIPCDSDDINELNLIGMLRSFNNLRALEINRHEKKGECCVECKNATLAENLLFSYFPLLVYIRLSLVHCMAAFQYTIINCHHLKYLHYQGNFTNDIMSLSLSNSRDLWQLCIQSHFNDVSAPFVNVLSAHGELERVVLFVRRITTNAIGTLINNSPNLILLYIATSRQLCNEDGVGVSRQVYIDTVSKMFSYHKLFTTGDFIVLYDAAHAVHVDEVLGRFNTDLSSLWTPVHC